MKSYSSGALATIALWKSAPLAVNQLQNAR